MAPGSPARSARPEIQRSGILRSAVEDYLHYCEAQETPLRIKELAARLGVTRETLAARFARQTGIRLSVFLREAQVQYAELLLRQTHYSVTRVAYMAGFGTRRTFFRAYRRLRGITPGEARAAAQGRTQESFTGERGYSKLKECPEAPALSRSA